MFEIEVPGDVVGKARPRMNTRVGRAYTPTNTKNYEYFIRQCFLLKYQRFEKIEGPVKVTIKAFFSVAKSASNRKKEKMLKNEIRPTKKPDIDNITKIVLDALNKFAFEDDVQVVELNVEKYYADYPKIYVKVEEIENGEEK